MNNVDRIKKKWANGEVCLGTSVCFSDAAITELFGEAGFDFVWIDCEHGALTLEHAANHVRAARGAGIAPFLRVPSGDPVVAKPWLELHPAAIIVPRINSAADAEQAVSSCRYPPRGIRGIGTTRGTRFTGMDMADYLGRVDDELMVIIQIEHIDAVNDIDNVLDVPGIDAVVVGPADLSGTMGLTGQSTHPDVAAAIDKIFEAAVGKGIPMGQSCFHSVEATKHWLSKGASWLSLDADFAMLFKSSRTMIEEVRGLV